MWTLPTFDWPQQKQKCLSCRHYTAQEEHLYKGSSTIMLCRVGNMKGRRGIGTCIDNRTRGKCGTHATLWEEKDA